MVHSLTEFIACTEAGQWKKRGLDEKEAKHRWHATSGLALSFFGNFMLCAQLFVEMDELRGEAWVETARFFILFSPEALPDQDYLSFFGWLADFWQLFAK